jgi:carbamoyl-phosphate synthase large subunit
MKILFTGGGGAGSEAIYRSLKDSYDIHFSDADVNAINPLIPNNCRHAIPMAKDPKFVEEVKELCDRLSIDLLVPSVDEELALLSKLDSVNVMLPDSDYINIMLDKFRCNQALIGLGLNAPKTTIIADYKKNNWMYFPCIAKPISGRGSRDVYIIDSAEQVGSYLNLTGLGEHEAILQEKIVGVEYTVLVAADLKTNLHVVVPVRVVSKKGITISAMVEHNLIVEKACSDIHNRLPARGCYNIQLMLTDDGMVFPFEINPRISTTFCMSLMSGIDPINIYFNKYAPEALLTYKTGLKLHRYWVNDFS